MKQFYLLCACVVVIGCANPLWNDSWHVGDSTLDYAKLFRAAYQLTSPDMGDNVAGINATIGQQNTQKVVAWYEATILGIEAAKAMRDKVYPRNLLVMEIVYVYETTD